MRESPASDGTGGGGRRSASIRSNQDVPPTAVPPGTAWSRDAVYLGAGRDYMSLLEDDGHRDIINCGPGKDEIEYLESRDRTDRVRGCEVVTVLHYNG